MKKSLKAASLSALVFPGAGHIFLKKYLVGTALISATSLSLYFVISKQIERAWQIVEKIQMGETQPDLTAISELLANQNAYADTRQLKIASILLLFFWVGGIIDSYLVGRAKDKADTADA